MAPPSTQRLLRRGIAATAVAGLAVAGIATAGPAAAADGSTTVTLTANGTNTGGRTLVLTDLTGQALSQSSGLAASSGSSGFITGVTDNNYTNAGYTVQATMTNLYKKTGPSTYDCTNPIPSNTVSIVQDGALDLTNIAATVQPVFDLAGSIVLPITGSLALPTGASAPTTTGTAKAFNATQLLGSANAALSTDGTLAGLPVNATKGNDATFSSPATFGLQDCGTSTGPTTPVLLSGSANPGGVQGVLKALLTPGTNGVGVQSLISSGYTTLDAVKLALAPLVTGGLSVLAALGVTQVTGIIDGLKGLTQSGSYKVNPTLKVDVPNTASGDYVGVMTVTLADT